MKKKGTRAKVANAGGWITSCRYTGTGTRMEGECKRVETGGGTYPCFHTGGTSDARYGASRPALIAPYTRCTGVNCPARYRNGMVQYVIGPRMADSLHGGALPVVVVLFARHGPHMCSLLHINARLLDCVTSFVEQRRRSLFLPLSRLSLCSVSLSSVSSPDYMG